MSLHTKMPKKFLTANKKYRKGDVVCKMKKPQIVPILDKGMSTFSSSLDSWETLRRNHNLQNSHVIVDKRKASHVVWYDMSISGSISTKTHDMPAWSIISKSNTTKQANVEMTTQGIGLGPKWRASHDIEIGDEIVCNFSSEYFTRSDIDLVSANTNVKPINAKTLPIKKRPLVTVENSTSNETGALKDGIKSSNNNAEIENLYQFYASQPSLRTLASLCNDSASVSGTNLQENKPKKGKQVALSVGPYNHENKKHKRFSDFIDFYRRTFKCENTDIKMFQIVKKKQANGKKVTTKKPIVVHAYGLYVDINANTFCRHTPTGIARIILHDGIQSSVYNNKINGWDCIYVYIPSIQSDACKTVASMDEIKLSNRCFSIGNIREAAGLVELKKQYPSTTFDKKMVELKAIFAAGGCKSDSLSDNNVKHVCNTVRQEKISNCKKKGNLNPSIAFTPVRRRKKTVAATGQHKKSETVKRRPGRPKGLKKRNRPHVPSPDTVMALNDLAKSFVHDKAHLVKRRRYTIVPGFPPIPI